MTFDSLNYLCFLSCFWYSISTFQCFRFDVENKINRELLLNKSLWSSKDVKECRLYWFQVSTKQQQIETTKENIFLGVLRDRNSHCCFVSSALFDSQLSNIFFTTQKGNRNETTRQKVSFFGIYERVWQTV